MKVLIALDGSPVSEYVMHELKNLKLGTESEVFVLSVGEQVGPIMAEPFSGALIQYQSDIEKQNLEVAREVIEKAKAEIEEEIGCSVKAEVAVGNPKYVIVEKAKEWGAEMVVLGSHGYGLWERVLLGSVSNFVASHAECSVLIARHSDS